MPTPQEVQRLLKQVASDSSNILLGTIISTQGARVTVALDRPYKGQRSVLAIPGTGCTSPGRVALAMTEKGWLATGVGGQRGQQRPVRSTRRIESKKKQKAGASLKMLWQRTVVSGSTQTVTFYVSEILQGQGFTRQVGQFSGSAGTDAGSLLAVPKGLKNSGTGEDDWEVLVYIGDRPSAFTGTPSNARLYFLSDLFYLDYADHPEIIGIATASSQFYSNGFVTGWGGSINSLTGAITRPFNAVSLVDREISFNPITYTPLYPTSGTWSGNIQATGNFFYHPDSLRYNQIANFPDGAEFDAARYSFVQSIWTFALYDPISAVSIIIHNENRAFDALSGYSHNYAYTTDGNTDELITNTPNIQTTINAPGKIYESIRLNALLEVLFLSSSDGYINFYDSKLYRVPPFQLAGGSSIGYKVDSQLQVNTYEFTASNEVVASEVLTVDTSGIAEIEAGDVVVALQYFPGD